VEPFPVVQVVCKAASLCDDPLDLCCDNPDPRPRQTKAPVFITTSQQPMTDAAAAIAQPITDSADVSWCVGAASRMSAWGIFRTSHLH
jgi:hypothetical protein